MAGVGEDVAVGLVEVLAAFEELNEQPPTGRFDVHLRR